jgi:hypothetical protein
VRQQCDYSRQWLAVRVNAEPYESPTVPDGRLRGGRMDAPVPRDRLAGRVAGELASVGVKPRQAVRVRATEARMRRGDQEAVGQVRAVVAMKALRVVNG